MTTIYIDEKIGYCEVNEKTETEIKQYLITKIIKLELETNTNADIKQKWVDIDNIRKTHKNCSIQELQGIIGDLISYRKYQYLTIDAIKNGNEVKIEKKNGLTIITTYIKKKLN